LLGQAERRIAFDILNLRFRIGHDQIALFHRVIREPRLLPASVPTCRNRIARAAAGSVWQC
jgi:hypothetical protein